MADIASSEMLRRLKSLVPRNWIAEFTLNPATGQPVALVANAVLGGVSDALTWVRSQGRAIRAQTRRNGTTAWLLDVDAFGFFGTWFLRRANQSDDAFRKAYTDEFFRPRGRRQDIIAALTDLTGRAPSYVELWNTSDCGGYGTGTLAYGGGVPVSPSVGGYGVPVGGYGAGSFGYGVLSQVAGLFTGAGRYGSLAYPFQIFIRAYRPQRPSIMGRTGYGAPKGGYGTGSSGYADLTEVQSLVSDADIYACVARNVAAGVTAWVNISD